VDAEVGVDVPAQAEYALVGELCAAQRAVAIDEGDASAGADIRRDHAARIEVVQQVGEDTELADLVADLPPVKVVIVEGVDVHLILTINAFELDPRADEVVADHAADSEARLRGHALAED